MGDRELEEEEEEGEEEEEEKEEEEEEEVEDAVDERRKWNEVREEKEEEEEDGETEEPEEVSGCIVKGCSGDGEIEEADGELYFSGERTPSDDKTAASSLSWLSVVEWSEVER